MSSHRVLIPTGASAALEDRPEYSMSGFCSGDAIVASLAKHTSLVEAEDLVEGASGHVIPWTYDDWDDSCDSIYADLEVQIVDGVVMFCR